MAIQRRTVHFSGAVQGVGFRYTTRQVAGGFAVTGNVRNLSDGRVRLVAEGESRELDAFLAAVQAEMEDYVSDVESAQAPATGEFSRFEIEH